MYHFGTTTLWIYDIDGDDFHLHLLLLLLH